LYEVAPGAFDRLVASSMTTESEEPPAFFTCRMCGLSRSAVAGVNVSLALTAV
jgi:hypothetical protein